MIMQRIYWISLVSLNLLMSKAGFSQNSDRLETLRAHKTAYITTALSLTPEESQQFWPVYNELEEKLIDLKDAKAREIRARFQKAEEQTLTASEYDQLFADFFNQQEEELRLKRTYHERFVKLLGREKVALLYKAEHDFRRQVLKRMRSRSSQRDRY